mgnify:CR=1 FL=1
MNYCPKILISRLFLCVFFFCVFVSNSYSSNFYEDLENENFVYYTSNSNPQIELEIDSQSNSILTINSILYNSEPRQYTFLPQEILAFGSADVTFNFPQNLVSELRQNPISVELDISSSSSNFGNNIKTIGDPTSFFIDYINRTTIIHYSSKKDPSLKSLSQILIMRGDDSEITFHLDNKIVEYEIQIGSQINESGIFSSNILGEIPNQFTTEISTLEAGRYPVEIYYKDIAGNEEIKNFELAISNPPLEITKVYSMQDSKSLYNYYYNSKFNENKIYSNSRNFEFVFETNYEASCYIEQVSEFRDFFNANSKTNQVRTHVLNISIASTSSQKDGIWIMCEDVNSNFREEERVYLSEKLFQNRELIDVEYIESRNDFSITSARPSGVITYTPIRLEATTNYPSVCEYLISNTEQSRNLDSNFSANFLRHYKSNVLPINEGEFDIEISCTDKLYNIDTTTLNIEIDTSRATELIDWNPKFSATQLVDFEIEISDESASCGIISNNRVLGSNNLEESIIQPTSQDGSMLYFNQIGPFSKIGKNENLYLRCQTAEGIVEELNFYLIYDPVGPRVLSVDLYNEEYGPTEFFSNSNYMRIEVNSNSSSIQYYLVEFENSNITINSTSNSIEVNDNFSLDSSVQIRAVDQLQRESNNLIKNFQFDEESPNLVIELGGSSTKRIITCDDLESACVRILYGTSSIKSSCLARTQYNQGEEVDIFGKNYLCAEAIDEAGNRVNITQQVSSNSGPFNPLGSNNSDEDPFTNPPSTNEDTNLSTNISPTNSNTSNSGEDPFTPSEPIRVPDEDEFNWVLLAAFGFLLLGVGGGGFYAYKKGYLDEQLKKMGIVTKRRNTPSSNLDVQSSNYSQIPKKNLDKNKFQSSVSQNNTNQSKYDSHINKLNSFINSTLNKDSEMFDQFEKERINKESNKKPSLKETLIRNKVKANDEKESFEKFHKSLNSNENKKTKK